MNCDKCHFAAIWAAQGFGSWALQNVASLAPCEKKLLLSIHPVTNPLNENLVSFGPVSLWQAWIHPNLPSTWGFPECTHHTRVWSQPASSPQWGASLVLICEVCQDLPSHNTAREWITPLRERTESSFVALEYCSTWSVCGGVLCWRCVFCA